LSGQRGTNRNMGAERLRYRRGGSGPPLLLLHGLGSDRKIWDPLWPALESTRDLIAVDLPGHGDSPAPPPGPTSPRAIAQTIADFLDELGLENVDVAGNSLGGWVALELAKMRRVRSVTAFSPAGLWRRHAPMYDIVTFRVYRTLAKTLAPIIGAIVGNGVTRTLLFWQFYGRPWALPPAAARQAALGFATAPGFDDLFAGTVRERFEGGGAIAVPVTIAWGTRDMLLLPWAARRRDQLPPHTRWLILPRCGHVPTYDDTPAVVRTLLLGCTPESMTQRVPAS
jgi:pimeloyl-ACP methyl ester carboxylesterase